MKKLVFALLTIFILQPLVAMDRPEKKPKTDSSFQLDGQFELALDEQAALAHAQGLAPYPCPPEMPLPPELMEFKSAGLNDRLHLAVVENHYKSIKQLLEQGADINSPSTAVDGEYLTPLEIAVLNNCLIMCDFLITNGANVHAQDTDRRTPLYHAAFFGLTQICELLLKHGADPNAQKDNSESILLCCIRSPEIEPAEKCLCAKILLKYGANINTLSSGKPIDYTPQARNAGRTPLMRAAALPDLPLCELFLQYGADDTVQSINGGTALTIAREGREANLFAPMAMNINPAPFNSIIALLSHPADIRAVILRRDNPRLQRAFANHSSICQALSKRELGWK